jgi:hypothetical protein
LTIEAQDVNWILFLFLSQSFPFNEIMHFQKFILMSYYAFTHHFPLSGTLKVDPPQQHLHFTLRMNGQTLKNT